MEYLYVFDYSAPALYEIPMKHEEDVEDVLNAHNIKEQSCIWMVVDTQLKLESLEYKPINK